MAQLKHLVHDFNTLFDYCFVLTALTLLLGSKISQETTKHGDHDY